MHTFDHGYALLVGVGGDIQETVNDARSIHTLLCDPLRCGYRPEHVKLLTGPDATRGNVEHGLEWLVECSDRDPTATIVFYYSGHATVEPATALVLHGCFADGQPCAATYEKEALFGNLLCEKLAKINSHKLLVLLDCCFAEAQVATFKNQVAPGFLSRLASGSGRVVLASSSSEERSRIEGRTSLFTSALLEGLAGYGSIDCDGYAKIFDITDYVQKQVGLRSRGRQHPIFKGDALSENFAVAFYSGGEYWQRPLGPDSPLPPRMPTQPETESERRLFANLKTLRDKARLLEDKLGNGGGEAELRELEDRLTDHRREIFTLEASLGLIYQQSPFHLHLSQWWNRFGLTNFLLGFFGYWTLQSEWRLELYGDTNRGSVSVVYMILSGICFAGLYFTGAFFQSNGTRGPWFYRLPIPFNFKPIFFEPPFARLAQVIVLLLFFLAPMFFQVYGFQRIAKETLWEFRRTENGDEGWFERKDILGLKHWTHYFGLRESLMGDKYALGRRETESQAAPGRTRREGITYFPFWGTWGLTLAFALWIALFFRLLRQIGALPNPWAATQGDKIMKLANFVIPLFALIGMTSQKAAADDLPIETSEIVVPIRFSVDNLAQLINEEIPSGVVASDSREENHYTRYSYTIRRDAPVEVTGSGNELVFRVPLKVEATGSMTFCAIWHNRRCIGPHHDEHGNILTEVLVELRVALNLDSEFNIRTQISVKAGLTGDTHLHLNLLGDLIRININVRDQLEGPLRRMVQERQSWIVEKVNELTAAVHLREILRSAWLEIQKPIKIGDARVLYEPEALVLGDLDIQGRTATILVGLRGSFAATNLVEAPMASSLPEPTALHRAISQLKIHLPLRLPYSALEDRIHLTLDNAGPDELASWIHFTGIKASGIRRDRQNAILFGLEYKADLPGAATNGVLHFTGCPRLHPQTRMLRIEELELAPASDAALASLGVSPSAIKACTEKVRRLLDSALGLKADEYIFLLNPSLQDATVGPLRLSGKLTRLQAYALQPRKDDFDLLLAAEGRLEILAFLKSE